MQKKLSEALDSIKTESFNSCKEVTSLLQKQDVKDVLEVELGERLIHAQWFVEDRTVTVSSAIFNFLDYNVHRRLLWKSTVSSSDIRK